MTEQREGRTVSFRAKFVTIFCLRVVRGWCFKGRVTQFSSSDFYPCLGALLFHWRSLLFVVKNFLFFSISSLTLSIQ